MPATSDTTDFSYVTPASPDTADLTGATSNNSSGSLFSATTSGLQTLDIVLTNILSDNKKIAFEPYNNQFTLSDGTTGYSALHYATKLETLGLDVLGDVTITNIADNQILAYDNSTSKFVNAKLAFDNIATGVVLDSDTMSGVSATTLATSESIKAYVDAQNTAQDLDFQGDVGGAQDVALGTQSLTLTGGTGINTTGSAQTMTFAIDSTVVQKDATQTLTAKTLTTPVIASLKPSNSNTLTMPDDTDTIIGRATTDTLTNKTINADNNTISNLEVDNLKSGVLDTDLSDASSNDDTLASAKAIKAYVDAHPGDITGVTAGNGLTGGGASGDVTLAVGGTTNRISVSADAIDIDSNYIGQNTITTLGTITTGEWNGTAIANGSLANSTITVTDGSNSTATALGGTITFNGTTNEIEVGEASGTITVGLPNNVTIAGNLTVNGTTTTINTENLSVEDPLIKLAKNNNTDDSLDIGFYGLYDTSGSQDLYAGLFRDANDSGKFKLFKDLQVEPTTTVDTTAGSYATGTLVANLEGNVTGNVTGNVSGSSGSTTGNAATATTATNVTASNNTADETVYLTFVDGATGSQGIETNTSLNYNPATNVLSAGTFNGVLNGNASTSSTATNVNLTDNTTDSTAFIPFAGNATGSQSLLTRSSFKFNAFTATLDVPNLIAGSADINGALDIPDSSGSGGILNIGSSSDLQIYHNGSNTIFNNQTGNLFLIQGADDADMYLQSDDQQGGQTTYIWLDGSEGEVKLRHAASGSASTKLTTKSTGVEVTGALITSGKILVNDITNATNTTDGSMQTDGGLSVVKDAVIGDDLSVGDNLFLNSDGAILKFGFNDEISLTHVHDTGLLLNSSSQLQFGDNGTYIHQSADGVLDLVADTELELNGGIVDINSSVGDINIGAVGGNVIISGDTGAMTLTNSGTSNITIDAEGNDTDIIFKGTDNNADITMLTLDGSEAGDATLNANLGVGTTPNANYPDTSWNAIDVSAKGGLIAYDGNNGSTGETLISTNAYHNGSGWFAKSNGEASGYSAKQDGTHTFYGTRGTNSNADASIAFNELFKITSDGAEIYGNTAGGYLQLNCENNSHGVKIQSPDHSAGQSYTLKLPDNQVAANKILKVKSITGSGATAVGQLEFADESAGSVAADDITAGDAAVTIATTTGNITIDAQGSNADIIFKGTDNTTDITMLTLDASLEGRATFNKDVVADQFSGNIYIGYNKEIRFEGSSLNSFDTILTVIDPTNTTKTISLPDATGTVITTGNSDTPTTTTSSGDADFVLVDDGGTMKKITPANLGIGSSSVALDDITAGDAQANLTTTSNISMDADGYLIAKGTSFASLTSEGTVYLNADNGDIKFQDNSSTFAHFDSDGTSSFLNGDFSLKTSDGAILNLQTSDTDVGNGDILGAINFQAPDESSGGDAVEIAAVIEAEAKSNFKNNVIETDLVFKVANDAAATERMRLTKSGGLKLTSTTNEDNLLIQTTFGSETGGTPDVKLYNDSTQAGTDNTLGVIKFNANTANHSNHQFSDIVGMAFSTTQNALEGGIRFRFAEGSDHSWGANEYLSFRPEKIQYYNGTSTTTLAFTTPTAGDVTLTLPNTTGTIALTSDGVAADDITTGDAAVNIATSTGNITIDAQGNDTDIIFKGTDSDGVGDITMLTLDASEAGNATFSGNVTAYSDERLKSEIKTINNALDKVMNMRGVSFTKQNAKGIGVIAQEVEKVIPEVVHDGEYKSVAYGNMVGVLIEAIKEQQKQIDELKKLVG